MNELVPIVCITFFIAGLVKGVIGLGLPTVSVAFLSATVGLPVALPLMVIPSAVTNLWQAVDGKHFWSLVRRFWLLLALNALGVWLGYRLVFIRYPDLMLLALGVVLCLYVLSSGAAWLRRMLLLGGRETLASAVAGATTGVLAGMTGSMVIPAVAFFNALALERDALIQMMGLSFTISTAALGLTLVMSNAFSAQHLGLSILGLGLALVGMECGRRIRHRLSDAVFRRCFMLGLLVVGIHLIVKSVLH